jgi:hypothetical protein
MVRKQVYIGAGQEQLLKQSAKRLGVTEAELIRRGLELAVAQRPGTHNRIASNELAQRAWREIESFIGDRMKIKAPQTGRGWTREELYEERLARFAR